MSETSFAAGIGAVPAVAWDALTGAREPLLRHAFLAALEDSGSVGAGTGWEPQHLLLHEGGRLLAAMPCYRKRHSYGEYVFDWSWADAYARHGLDYYPKLLTAVPFTPATGTRLLRSPDVPLARVLPVLLESIREKLRAEGMSSWHLLFPETGLAEAGAEQQLLLRTGVQYHWLNRDYTCFDDFLARLASRKRKQLRRERRLVAEQGLRIERLRGSAIDAALWDRFHCFYQMTYARRSGHGGYLSREFFHRLGAALPDNVLLVIAWRGEEAVAGALNVVGEDTLYGRYWGCTEQVPFLHFELCYYQAIDIAIARGLARVEAGAQGGHKLARGYEPVQTWSAHWIADPGFRSAVADFLERERAGVASDQLYLGRRTPFRKGD